ncbi:hypothetical protein RND71_005764 [Anisodus tanguticus]|uniref:Uncharacterized protein n=1 Tax=Anisodus tanguticus TaxID=243964 RepID=A0AAE1SS65_9SOLA|nr:hypothetical protein RND71_005764 [Anisodus tanguticus]
MAVIAQYDGSLGWSEGIGVSVAVMRIRMGSYDVCCPMMSAWDLHKAWPEAELIVVPGHSANEPGIAAELVAAPENILKGVS